MNVVYMYVYIYYHTFKCGRKKEGYKELYFRTEGVSGIWTYLLSIFCEEGLSH
jgi:hypothetical protein